MGFKWIYQEDRGKRFIKYTIVQPWCVAGAELETSVAAGQVTLWYSWPLSGFVSEGRPGVS